MISPAKLYVLSHKIDEDKKYTNKYTFMASEYSYPHMRVLNIGDLVSNQFRKGKDLPEYVMNFIGEKGEVLLIANIINREVPYVQLRDMNSKEFSVYGAQTKLFFGMGFLDKEFKYGDPIMLVEGSMDFSVGYSFYKNTLATMTAGLTSMQYEILKLLTNRVILAYDNDEAGRKATNRDSKKLKELGFEVKYLSHFTGFKDLGDLADCMFTMDTVKTDLATRYYGFTINNLLKSFGEV